MSQQSESVLNSVLIDMSRSFLQYMAEASPWVGEQATAIGEQVSVIAARQRQDVTDIVTLLNDREHPLDFGTYPTEYTDQQFLGLGAVFNNLRSSQDAICASISNGLSAIQDSGDEQAAELLSVIEIRQKEVVHALKELQRELKESGASA